MPRVFGSCAEFVGKRLARRRFVRSCTVLSLRESAGSFGAPGRAHLRYPYRSLRFLEKGPLSLQQVDGKIRPASAGQGPSRARDGGAFLCRRCEINQKSGRPREESAACR